MGGVDHSGDLDILVQLDIVITDPVNAGQHRVVVHVNTIVGEEETVGPRRGVLVDRPD